MKVVIVRDVKKLKLEECINGLRDVLNEMCAQVDDLPKCNERLIVSQCLDEFIVEYMKQSAVGSNISKSK